jgi:hypothetical protein
MLIPIVPFWHRNIHSFLDLLINPLCRGDRVSEVLQFNVRTGLGFFDFTGDCATKREDAGFCAEERYAEDFVVDGARVL